jgi:hypothetical protein
VERVKLTISISVSRSLVILGKPDKYISILSGPKAAIAPRIRMSLLAFDTNEILAAKVSLSFP